MSSEQISVNPQDLELFTKSFLTPEMIKSLEAPDFEVPASLDSEVESSYKAKHDDVKIKYLLASGVEVPKDWYEEVEGEINANRDRHAEIITMTVFRRRLEDIFLLLRSGVSDEDLKNELILHSRSFFEARLDSRDEFRRGDVTGQFKNREARLKSLGLLVNPTGKVNIEELIMIRDIVLNSYSS